MIGIIITGVLLIGYYTFQKYRTDSYVRSILNIMRSNQNFYPNYYQIMANNTGAIALDSNQRLLCIIDQNSNSCYLDRRQILNTEILIDQTSYHQKDFLKTWGKYFLLKSIGSESAAEASIHIAKEKHINQIKTLKLKIGTSNLDVPNHYLLFLKNGTEKQKRKILNDVYDWITRVEALKNIGNNGFRING